MSCRALTGEESIRRHGDLRLKILCGRGVIQWVARDCVDVGRTG